MFRVGRTFLCFQRRLHTSVHDIPSETFRRKIAEMEKVRKKRNPKKHELFVQVPESTEWLDIPSLSMVVFAVGVALVSKLLYMRHEATAQERLETKMSKLPPGTGTQRMVSREMWDKLGEVRPRTPFESRFSRPNSRIRTEDPVPLEDLKDWAIDVFADAFTRVEENVKSTSK